ncbi:ABC transporter permease [Ohessyouella blattaphilus]|uniref:ABC transporter permease n=1 Tax=Ohessyouella blattaphilus TaxID=2949333 RepID=A0ABT1ELF8_9FIRM|nr:ABC transporter permease [Ohessyouella blattaphilus]MCP1110521.1 ABC transporter permease [Ohessyouella blattaphilus]MCR8563915.1 ABC transporter permease [Ohessyouella blattaphilus]MDL2249481.1 ABC transporter permease [Lachnospiraceae bacterium OttesenSCG-928-J05]
MKTNAADVNFKKINLSRVIPFAGLILVTIFFTLVSHGNLLSIQNVKLLINQMFTLCVGAIGCAFVVAQGNLDFSVGGILGVSATFAAYASQKSIGAMVITALGVSLAIGLINGFIHAKLKVESFVLTLAMQFVLQGVIVIATKSGTVPIPFSMYSLDNLTLKIITVIVVGIIGYIVFEYSAVGKYSKAIGSGIEATRQSGISVNKYKIVAFMISAFTAGICSIFVLVRTGAASTATGKFFETDVLTALVLGGISLEGGSSSKISSAIIGSLTLAILSNGMVLWGINEHYQQLAKGLIFIVAVWLAAGNSRKKRKG